MGNKGSTLTKRRHTGTMVTDKDNVKNPLARHSQTSRTISQSEPRKATSFAQRIRASGFYGQQQQYNEDGIVDGEEGEDLTRSSYQQAGDILEGLDKSYIIPFRHLELETPPIAAGGGGQIYRAEMHGAVVAVKALYSQLMTGDVDDLKHEVGMIARARCPNIISFYGVSHHCGVTYIVTEFCPLSLADVVGRSQFDGKAFSQVATQILQALVYLHSNNIAHRDIKPPNVLMLSDGCVKLCDLGMSKFVDQKKISMSGGIVGSPTYMPPESFESLKSNTDNHHSNNDQNNDEFSSSSRNIVVKNDIDGVLKIKDKKKQDKDVKVDGKAWDMYSLGIMFWWMWHYQDPYSGSSTNIFQVAEIVKKNGRPEWFKKQNNSTLLEQSEGERKECFVEAPIELRAFVEELWAQDSFERPSAALSLQKFKKHVIPALLKVGSLRPMVQEGEVANMDDQTDLGVDYDRSFMNLNELIINGTDEINSESNQKKKKKKVGVKFKFEDEDVIASEQQQDSGSSNPSSPTSSNPSSPTSGQNKNVPQSSLLTPSTLTMSKLLPHVPSPAQQKYDQNENLLHPLESNRPTLFQPPKPPPSSSSTPSSSSSQVVKVDMMSKPDKNLKSSLESMMTPGKMSVERLRSRLLLELVAAGPLLRGDGHERGPSVMSSESNASESTITRQSSAYGSNDVRSISTNSMSSIGSSSPQSPSSPLLNSQRKRSSALSGRPGSGGQFSTMLQRQESIRLQEVRTLRGRQMRTDSEAIMYDSTSPLSPLSSRVYSGENTMVDQMGLLDDVVDEVIQESPEKTSPTSSPRSASIKSSTSSLPMKSVVSSSSSSNQASNRLAAKDDGSADEAHKIRIWMMSIVGSELLSQEGNLLIDLKDGVVLCELLNTLLKRRLAGTTTEERRLSNTEASLYSKAMIQTVHQSPLGFKQMENIATFIKSCRSLQLSRQSVGGSSVDILFDIGHLRSNLPNGLSRVITTLKALRSALDDDYEDDDRRDNETNNIKSNESQVEQKEKVLEEVVEEEDKEEIVHVSKVFDGGMGEGGGVARGGEFAVESPMANNTTMHHRTSSLPTSASSSASNEAHPRSLSSPSPPPPPPPPPSSLSTPLLSPNTAEIERRRLMDKFKTKAMTSSSKTTLTSTTISPVDGQQNGLGSSVNSGNEVKIIPSPSFQQSRKTATPTGNEPEQGVFQKGSVKIIFRENN